MTKPTGPYIKWEDYGSDGWKPTSYATLEDAVKDKAWYDSIITKEVTYKVEET